MIDGEVIDRETGEATSADADDGTFGDGDQDF